MTARYILISLLNIALGVIAFFLGLRIVLRLFAANPETPFVSWVYGVSNTLIDPFRGIFPNAAIGTEAVFDVPAFIALIVYAMIIYLAIALVDAAMRAVIRTDHEQVETERHAHV